MITFAIILPEIYCICLDSFLINTDKPNVEQNNFERLTRYTYLDF